MKQMDFLHHCLCHRGADGDWGVHLVMMVSDVGLLGERRVVTHLHHHQVVAVDLVVGWENWGAMTLGSPRDADP